MSTAFERMIPFESAHVFPCKYRNVQNLPHWHREHELILVLEGEVTVMADGNFFTLQKDGAAFLHSESLHCFSSTEGSVSIVAKFDPEHFRPIIGGKRLKSPILTQCAICKACLPPLLSEMDYADAYRETVADSISALLIAKIFRIEAIDSEAQAHGKTATRYRALLDLISARYTDITFEEAAAHMHFSRPYFSKYFVMHTGMTFSHYLNTVRVAHAAELLCEGTHTVTEISGLCGFNTIRSFNRVFRSLTGYTPSALPSNYTFASPLREYRDSGFDPTIGKTEVMNA
jgi:AraC-like DNA-binding protein